MRVCRECQVSVARAARPVWRALESDCARLSRVPGWYSCWCPPPPLCSAVCVCVVYVCVTGGMPVEGVDGGVRNPIIYYTAPTLERLQVVAVATYWCLSGGDEN